MNNLHKRSLVVALIALLSVGVVGAAVAAGTNKGKPKAGTVAAKAAAKAQGRGAGHGYSDELDAAAAYLGLTVAQIQTKAQAGQTLAQIAGATSGKSVDGLVAALVAAEKTEIAAKVTAGKITQAQADAVIPTLTATFTAFVNGTGGSHGPGLGGHRGGHSDELDAAATYLGIPAADVLTKVQAGQTLAQIAGATSGKTVAGLVAALVAAEKTELATAVTAGRITQAQADAIIPTLTATFTAFVNGTGGPHGAGGAGGHGGKHFRHP